ncbi:MULTISPECIES: hypothetical protein [unclassified Micromonospora]
MSGRRLGRLLGSFLALAAVAGGVFVGDASNVGDAQLLDFVWNMPKL